jgi:hypothetical protein
MSIIEESIKQIKVLESKREEIISLKDQLSDAPYHIFSINALIRDAEMRYERFKAGYSPIKCTRCLQTIEEGRHSITIGKRFICNRCLHTISQVMNTTEMEERGGMILGTVKQDCHGILSFLHETSLIRKSGKCWLVHEALFELFYRAGRSKKHLNISWIVEMENHLRQLQLQHHILNGIKGALVGSTLLMFSLDAQIRDYENRLQLIKGGTMPFRCTQCKGWIKDAGIPILLGHYTLCSNCKCTIEQVFTTSEAENLYGLTVGTIRRDIHRGQLHKYQEMGLLRQSGSIWLMHEYVIINHYFPEEETVTPAKPTISPR